MNIDFAKGQQPDYSVLFLDMDAFFASCEQQLRPELRGRPIGVVPQIVDTTCVLSPSYEAKRLGIKTGTGVRQARLICPNMVFVEARPSLYKDIHYRIQAILESISPWYDPKSIDEFSLKLSPSEQNEQSVRQIAHTIKETMCAQLGPYLTCSIGIAQNQFLAKVASELRKPNGFVIITGDAIISTLAELELTDLPGIATAMSRRFKAEAIYTVEQLLRTDMVTFRRIAGFMGVLWWYRLHGYEVDTALTKRSSIGHSHVLAPSWRPPDKAYQVLQRLVHKVGQRLRREGYVATLTSLYASYINQPGHYAYLRTHAYDDSRTMIALAERFFASRPYLYEPIFQLAFTASGLVKINGHAQQLFADMERPAQLTRALDSINDRYGRDTISVSSMLNAQATAPDRIPFGRLRY